MTVAVDSPQRRRERTVQGFKGSKSTWSHRAADLAEDLLGHLREHARGRENAVPLADLAHWYGTDWRTIARAIELLRGRGYAVGTARSKPHGAFWPVTDEDYEAALRPFFTAAKRMMQTYWRLVKRVPGRVIERMDVMEQQELFRPATENIEDTERKE